MDLPADYLERTYAGVLGKIIGVYLGRPFEGWTKDRILAELGEIWYYVHDKRGVPLVVTDDDISGTFTFVRALEDYGFDRHLTSAQIGQTWLNYLIENRTILWWGGLGNSTEHTAYLRLKNGFQAPESGSREINGKVVSEQIGAQIFIDGWAMVAPGNPELAADLAFRAGSVSHDGEALYGAQVIAAMESLAYIEPDLNKLVDKAVSFIPSDSIIYRMIAGIRELHEKEKDWQRAFDWLSTEYGYHKYGGNCHIIPNHGLIHLSLLYGDDDFQKSLMIVNTCGWDTDCNSANVGCLMGIKNGLAGIDNGPDWRGSFADRLYLPTADGGRSVTDAATEAIHLVNTGRILVNEPPITPKSGARFHFELPGSLQGWQVDDHPQSRGVMRLENVAGHSQAGSRSLALHYSGLAKSRLARAYSATFLTSDSVRMPGYGLIASPTLYPGQMVRACLTTSLMNPNPVNCKLYLYKYGADDKPMIVYGPQAILEPDSSQIFDWKVPDTHGDPIADIGIEITSEQRTDGTLYLDYFTWSGTPTVTLGKPQHNGTLWRKAWIDGIDWEFSSGSEAYRIIQNEGTGLLIQGTREWQDYQINADITPHLAKSAGIAAYVQGMRRYYAFLLCQDKTLRLVKALDGLNTLAEIEFIWEYGQTHQLSLAVTGNTRLVAWIDDKLVFDMLDSNHPLMGGAMALVIEEGRTATHEVKIVPYS
jgi:ADP-ribosylglycohydrolase